ncbi:prepilin-type N-terminal cleavage/methylation domain-containing protein [Candidatus Sumerlaeota bacterium]|nr:prepilin-type N-terminal cleavage/methylation domain-containing protein [Candidatus Sumerlaeota bacterium]
MQTRHMRAFTLIELLIVVAIIAILAAIAVPNFLEAQTRAKVSRLSADLRSLRTAIEAYVIDYNRYPETDTGEALPLAGAGPIRLTTPVAYITSMPQSPFMEDMLGYSGIPKHAVVNNWPLYIRAILGNISGTTVSGTGIDSNYALDRAVYLYEGDQTDPRRLAGHWALKSVGPDNVDNRDSAQLPYGPQTSVDQARVYDPTNGTISGGDIMVYSDEQGLAGRNI